MSEKPTRGHGRSHVDAHKQARTAEIEALRAEVADLRKKLFWHEALLDAVPYPIFAKGGDYRFCNFNRAYEDFFGVQRADLLGLTVRELLYLPEADREVYYQNDVECVRSSVEDRREMTYDTPTGQCYTLYRTRGICVPQTGERGMVGSIVDISLQKQYERDLQTKLDELEVQQRHIQSLAASLRSANERMATVIAAAQLFTFEIDFARDTFKHNAQWCRVWEAPGEPQDGEVPFSRVAATVDPESEAAYLEGLRTAHLHDSIEVDIKFTTFAGNERWCHLVGRVEAVDANGRVSLILGMGLDVTEKRLKELQEVEYMARLEEMVAERTRELEESRQRAEDSNKAKSVFLSTVSHEIRTPMNAIMGFVHLFRRDNLTDSQNSQLDKIYDSSRMLLGLINDVLDISKIESGKLELENRAFAILSVVDFVHSIVGFLASNKGVEMTVHVEPNVPIVIMGDSQRLQQILVNLMNNAVKFTSKGFVRLKVSLRHPDAPEKPLPGDAPVPHMDDGRVLIGMQVQDTGIGISPEQMKLIFTPFVQADSSITRRYGGTGLGLSISRRLASMMGGDISVSSEEGKGSTFDVVVRVFEAPEGEGIIDERPRVKIDSAAARAKLRGKTVLLVEDNAINQEIGQAMLEQFDLKVSVAGNGLEAIAAVKLRSFDCIFMDMQMPVMGGIEATENIRALGREAQGASDPDIASLAWLHRVPIIAMTANAMAEDRPRCLNAGMDDHIGKPIEPKVLAHCLEHWLCKEEQGAPR